MLYLDDLNIYCSCVVRTVNMQKNIEITIFLEAFLLIIELNAYPWGSSRPNVPL